MRIATLYYSPTEDSTRIRLNEAFEQSEKLMRLDALQDAIGLLQQEYEKTYKLWTVSNRWKKI